MAANSQRQPNTKTSKITVKETKLVNGIAKGKSKRQAGIDAGYGGKPETVSVHVSHALRKESVQQALQDAFVKHGIDIDSAVAPIGKGLKALKMNEFTGEVTEDLKTQMQASDRALKLMGINQNTEGGTTNYNFINVSKADKDEFDL